jgi:hypothetical protein
VQLPAYTADTADIVRRTKALAAANGEKTPIKIEQVFTTSARAESVNGNGTAVLADAAANASVRVVEVRGSFIGSAAKVPQDAAKPKGSAMLVTFDASSGKLTDWSILKSYVDLGQIGRATPLA